MSMSFSLIVKEKSPLPSEVVVATTAPFITNERSSPDVFFVAPLSE